MSDQPAVVNRQHVPGCSCDTANDDPALNVADPVCKEWTKIFHRYLAAHDAAVRAEVAVAIEAQLRPNISGYHRRGITESAAIARNLV